MTHFSTFELSNDLQRALSNAGYEQPTPIQEQAIPPALAGRDMLGCAQTGTGKTAAFALPIIQRLHSSKPPRDGNGKVAIRALVLSPTRELASQIADSFSTYGRFTRLRHVVIFGGVKQYHQARALNRGVDVVIATPGRLQDLMNQGLVDLSRVECFALDEADRMLDMGFIQPIRKIAAELPKTRQTFLFSATMPKSIQGLAESLLNNPVRVAVTPVASAAPMIEQSVHMVHRAEKQNTLERLLRGNTIERALVFTRTKHGADKVCKKLGLAGIPAGSIHGNKSQAQRERALDGFRRGRSRVLVATDVAARGLDVDGISHVFNFDLPNEPEVYVHRIGRTGRAGATGIAISFCDSEERGFLRAIERLTGSRLAPMADDGSAGPIEAAPPRDREAGNDRPERSARRERTGVRDASERGGRDGGGSRGRNRGNGGPGGFNNRGKKKNRTRTGGGARGPQRNSRNG